MAYEILTNHIPVDLYIKMRKLCGLSPRSEEAATIGLKASLYCLMVKVDDQIVGMGRVIGDGGTACQIVDICVLPIHQGKGYGTVIMKHIMNYVHNELPRTCFISLIADGDAAYLYEKFGFERVAPGACGMSYMLYEARED